jgi:fused signal recognition particle receptor
MGLFDKLKNQLKIGLQKTTGKLVQDWGGLFTPGAATLSEETRKALEERLVAADVGVPAARSLLDGLVDRCRLEGKADAVSAAQYLREAIAERLRKAAPPLDLPKPVVILLVGVNGAGKTTTAGKLSAHFASQDRRVLLAAGDTFRAAAEEQLTEWARRAKVELFRAPHGAAPSSVVFDALKTGLQHGEDTFVVDTAGRLHNRANLMEELRKIERVAEKAAPGIAREKWLVVDATTGQNALSQAREFHAASGLTGVVLTKLDGTAKGGVVVALAGEGGFPVRYIGVGEGLEDLVPFDPELFAEALIPSA